MTTHTLNGREVLLVEVAKDATGFVVDNAMQYFIFKVPNYKNWVTDKQLGNPGLLLKYLDTHSPDNDYKTSGVKLPPGIYSLPPPTTVSGMREEVAKGLVGEVPYRWGTARGVSRFKEYLKYFIKSKSLDPDRVVVVIKEK